MGGGRAKALADPGRGAGGSQGSRTEALTPTKAGVLGSLPGVGTKNTWDVRRKEGVSRADSLGLAPRPEKREWSYPWAGNGALGALRVKAKGAERGGKATRRAGLPGRGGTRRTSAAGPRERRAPTRGRRSPTCPRGAGSQKRPRPKGPVTRGRQDRTRPAAPSSCLLSLPHSLPPPAAR